VSSEAFDGRSSSADGRASCALSAISYGVGHRGCKEPNHAETQDAHIPDANLDQFLVGANAKTLFDPNGLLDDLS
jgi:hypothetical protein